MSDESTATADSDLYFEYAVDDEVSLRLLQPHELPAMHAVMRRNRDRLCTWFANPHFVGDLDALHHNYQQWIDSFANGEGMSLAIVHRGDLAGWIWYTRIDHRHGWAEIGYWIDHAHEGRGIVTRACRVMTAIAFDALGLHRVLIRASTRNERSWAVPMRLGFVREGVAREGMRLPDGYHDSVHYSILEHEWRGKHTPLDPPFALTAPLDDDLALHFLEQRHAEALFGIVDANRAHLAAWFPWVSGTHTADDTRTFRADVTRKFARGQMLPVGILLDGELVGHIGMQGISPETRSAEIGYWLTEHAQGRGAVTRACRALMRHGFETLGLNRVYIRVCPENRRSCAVAERLGMTLEGTFRQAGYVDGGKLVDLNVYATLADEWHAAQTPPTPVA